MFSESISNLYKKIAHPPAMKTRNFFCFWSDLLGFGEPFLTSNWKLSEAEKRKIYERLQRAHSIFLHNSVSLSDYSLILNDGLVRLHEFEGNYDNFHPGFFLRSCVYIHNFIKLDEQAHGLPGPRSMLSFGESIEYLTSNIHIDDYVLSQTKPEGKEISNIARSTGNPIIVYNPAPFQMNTAFSKAYLLESVISKFGMKGSALFVDESVIQFTKAFAENSGKKLVVETYPDYDLLIIENGGLFPLWGFKVSKGKEVSYKDWKTIVYQLLAYYPPDEKYTEFEIPIE